MRIIKLAAPETAIVVCGYCKATLEIERSDVKGEADRTEMVQTFVCCNCNAKNFRAKGVIQWMRNAE